MKHLNGNRLEKYQSTYSDGKLTFYTDHFSTYTIVSKAKETKKDDSSPKLNNILPKTGLTENSVGSVLLGLLGVVLAALGIRRKR